MSWLRQVLEDFAARPRRADDLQEGHELIPPRSGIVSWAGVPVTERIALQQVTVWACAALITDSIAMLPIDNFRGVGPTRQPVDPPAPLLQRPHAEMDLVDWISRLVYSAVMRGNAYGWIIERDQLGFARQIMPLHPDEVWPRRNKRSGRIEYEILGEKGRVAAFDMLHVRGMTLPGSNSVAGLNPIEYVRQAVGLSLGVAEFGARFFGDGGHPSGVLEAEGTAKVSEDDAKRYQDMWLEAHGQRHRKPAVLGGGLKWKPISIAPNEAQFLETRKYSRSEIAGFFRVPPHMIGDVERSTSWGTGIEEQSLGFVTFTLGIWLVRFERAISALLPRNQYARFNVGALLKGRLLEQAQAFLLARQGGWRNVDEIRALLDLPPVPDGSGQVFSQPLNWGPLPRLDGSMPDDLAGGPAPEDSGERIARALQRLEDRLVAAGNGHRGVGW